MESNSGLPYHRAVGILKLLELKEMAIIKSMTSKMNADAEQPTIKCTFCKQKFHTLPQTLKHELVSHNKMHLLPPKVKQSKCQIKEESQQNPMKEEEDMEVDQNDQSDQSDQLSHVLENCEAGLEHISIINARHINIEKLKMVFKSIMTCLIGDLEPLENIYIYPFGSIVTGLGLRDCDVDLYICDTYSLQFSSEPYCVFDAANRVANNQILFNKIHQILRASCAFEKVYAIRQARVPIIKCKHKKTGFSLDINVSCPSSMHNTTFLRAIMLLDKRVHELFLFLKVWAKELGLIGPGNMSSYCLVTLVIFFMQQPCIGADGTELRAPLLPSIKKLQSGQEPRMVLGVNYVYDLQTHVLPIAPQLTVTQLIAEFFAYYVDFEFEKKIICPFLGQTIPVHEFSNGDFEFDEYVEQLNTLLVVLDTPVQEFTINHRIHVQDPFALNHNIGMSMSLASLRNFRKCIKVAHEIFCDVPSDDTANIYKRLFSNLNNVTNNARIKDNAPMQLTCSFTPSRAELRALTAFSIKHNIHHLFRQWLDLYIAAFREVLVRIYLLDVQFVTPSHLQNRDQAEDTTETYTWLINGNIDTWTGRVHIKNPLESFFESQFAQTTVMQRNAKNLEIAPQVNLHGIIRVEVSSKNKTIKCTLSRQDNDPNGITKSDPLRKFFNMFRYTMQNWKLYETLSAEIE